MLAEIAEETKSGSGKSVWKEVLASSMPLAERRSILKSYYVRAFSGTKNFDDWLIVASMYSRSLGINPTFGNHWCRIMLIVRFLHLS